MGCLLFQRHGSHFNRRGWASCLHSITVSYLSPLRPLLSIKNSCCLYDVLANPLAAGLFNFTITPTRAGLVTIYAGIAYSGGLSATYYSDDAFSAPVALRTDTALDFAAPPWYIRAVAPTAGAGALYSVAWGGFIRPRYSQVYTFSALLRDEGAAGACDGRVALWIDNAIVLAQWDSLASAIPAGTFLMSRAEQLFAVSIRYKAPAAAAAAGGPGAFRLLWQTNFRGRKIQQQVIPAGRLHWMLPASGAAVVARVMSAAASVSATRMQGSYSGALTASDEDGGAAAAFNATLTLCDPFGNPALPPPDNILAVRVRSVATLVETRPALHYTGGSTFQVTYVLSPAAIFSRALFIVQAAARGGLDADFFDDGRLLNQVSAQKSTSLTYHTVFLVHFCIFFPISGSAAFYPLLTQIESCCRLQIG